MKKQKCGGKKLKNIAPNGWLSLREVFYRDNGKIDGYTADPMTLSAENEQEFVYQNYLMQKAFNKPILTEVKNKLKEIK